MPAVKKIESESKVNLILLKNVFFLIPGVETRKNFF
jgi:hypothetical protein